MKEEEDFQTWLADNRDLPLSEEVTRLQRVVTRLEARHQTDYRRLQRAEFKNGGACSARGFSSAWDWWPCCSGT